MTPPQSPQTAHDRAHHDATTIVDQLTITEKISLLHQAQPAIDHAGLAPFTTGTEALHGVAWLGEATTFPQPIGLAATWDTDLITRIGTAVATEVRAHHAINPTVSLNVWAPVVNPLRHPLWGRNEEGYSEDPHLTADCAIAYTQGLRGQHPTVWTTVPTLKHFLAYNNEIDRAVTSSDMRPRVLEEYEYPAFRRPLAAGTIGAVMPSYNLVNERPNHLAKDLLDTLRTWSPHPIAVVSDAAAPTNVVEGERYLPTHTESHAAMLHAGIDSFTDNDRNNQPTIDRLTAALDQDLITEEQITQAAYRLLYLRALTGEFRTENPYGHITANDINTPEHQALAREAAAKNVVILKNNETLPLRPTSLAVVGPFADHTVTDWYSGTPPYTVTLAQGLRDRFGDIPVTTHSGWDTIALWSPTARGYVTTTQQGTVDATAHTLNDTTSWEMGEWGQGVITLRSRATTRYLGGANWILDAHATRIGGWVAQEAFQLHEHADHTISLLHRGSGKWVRVQHGSHLLVADTTDPAAAERFTRHTVESGALAVSALVHNANHVIVAVGNDPHLHGRETEDRPTLELPASAQQLWRIVTQAHTPTTLAIMSSYPYTLGPIADEADAIIWSSHAGQELGHGITDILVGDHEPWGRLAQEWVTDDTCPPHILNYDIIASQGTYWYNPCEPLFDFGAGLTYTTIAYSDLTLVTNTDGATTHAPTHAAVTITNTGERTAHELVQVYTGQTWAPHVRSTPPARRLAGYTRATLTPGDSTTVTVPLNAEAFATWDTRTHAFVTGGDYDVWVGTSRTRRIVTHLSLDRDDAPLTLAATTLRAIDFDDPHRVRLSNTTLLSGDCVAPAHGFTQGSIDFHNVAFTNVTAVTAHLSGLGPGELGTVSLHCIDNDTPPLQWTTTHERPTCTDRYTWHAVNLPLLDTNPPTAHGTLRITVTGNVRVNTITFHAD